MQTKKHILKETEMNFFWKKSLFLQKKHRDFLHPCDAKTACYFYASPKILPKYIYNEYFFFEIYTIWHGILMVMVILAKNSLSECVSCSVGVVNVNVDGNSIRIHQWHETPLAYLFGWNHRAVIIANFDVSARSDPEYFSYIKFLRNKRIINQPKFREYAITAGRIFPSQFVQIILDKKFNRKKFKNTILYLSPASKYNGYDEVFSCFPCKNKDQNQFGYTRKKTRWANKQSRTSFLVDFPEVFSSRGNIIIAILIKNKPITISSPSVVNNTI